MLRTATLFAVLTVCLGRLLMKLLQSGDAGLTVNATIVAGAVIAAVSLAIQILSPVLRARLARTEEQVASSLLREMDHEWGQRVPGRQMPVQCVVTKPGGQCEKRAFNKIPHKWPLWIRGAAGSGMSVIALSLALGVLRSHSGLVPVIVPGAALNGVDLTNDDALLSAIGRQMCRSCDGRVSVRLAYALAERLKDERRLLLIIDGLPARQWRAAQQRMEKSIHHGPHVVVLCRRTPYGALAETGRGIGSATVVEVLPLTSKQAAKYLDHVVPGGDWARLVRQAHGRGADRLQQLLGNPRLLGYVATVADRVPGYAPAKIVPTGIALRPGAAARWLRAGVIMHMAMTLPPRSMPLLKALAAVQRQPGEESVAPWGLIAVMPGLAAMLRGVPGPGAAQHRVGCPPARRGVGRQGGLARWDRGVARVGIAEQPVSASALRRGPLGS